MNSSIESSQQEPAMLEFHCCLHGTPSRAERGQCHVRGIEVETIRPLAQLEPLSVTFERAAERLTSIQGLHFELDGWFILGHGSEQQRWQVDGQLTDGGTVLEFVELKGTCPADVVESILGAFCPDGEPLEALSVQLVKEGVFVDVPTMIRVTEQSQVG